MNTTLKRYSVLQCAAGTYILSIFAEGVGEKVEASAKPTFVSFAGVKEQLLII